MRLHSLELAAIGPFASAQRIDFEELQASGLFLLDGPTGAGKTTVLDAITFALYGPGENRGDGRLHSDFAAVEVEPFVTLEFSLRGVRYRLRRTPEFERPKKRGDGVTVAYATAHLERFQDGRWVSRSSNKAEIAEILDDELGLTREQFLQVVLLPQGEFATFLRAKDDERRGVLSRLFGTGLYQRLTDELDARRAEAARRIASAGERVRTCVAVAAEAAGLDAVERDELCALSGDEREARFDTLVVALDDQCQAATANAEDATAAAAGARAASEAAAAEQALVVRFAATQADLAAHAALAGKVNAAREKVRDALRAEPVRALLDVLDEATSTAARLRTAAGEGVTSEQIAEALATERELTTAGEVAAGRRDALAAQVHAAQEVARLTPGVAAARAAAAAAVDEHQAATDEHLRLFEVRLAGMAGELAASLAQGVPCAVCGSTEHPAPAQPADDAVDAQAVRAAQLRRDEAAKARKAAERALSKLEHALTAAASLADEAALDDLDRELAALDETIRAGQRAAAAQRRLDEAAELVTAAEQAEAALAKAALQVETEAARAGFATVDEARAAVLAPEARADLDTRIAAWDAKAAALSAVVQATEFDELRAMSAAEVETRRTSAVEASERTEAELRRAEAARTDAAAAADRAQRAVQRFAERRADVVAADDELRRLEAESATVIHLAKLARGMAGQRRVALTTYVLRHWFEHVVDAANVRLSSISSGRYSLVRVDEGDTRSERAGLTLHVIDAHTGEARSPRSLSGGETFYTSLALALGLADVVRAEAGGVDLDTLFIDEGFGTLDSDTLEQVMSVIDELRDRGRVVGIVSHVAELKERIPERLEVRRLPDGSSALRVVA
jgi:exonuclease SbcC